MRELHRNVRRQFAPLNSLEDAEIVIANLRGFRSARHLLAQFGQQAADARLAELRRGVERRVECLPRHEASDRALEETPIAKLFREPLAARGSEQNAAGESHGEIV